MPETRIDPRQTEVAAVRAEPVARPQRGVAIPVNLAKFTETYTVSRNPFGIAAVLPMIVIAFLLFEVGLLIDSNLRYVDLLVGGFAVVVCGLLLIPSVVLRGDVTFNDDGLSFTRGRDTVSATWREVTGLTYQADSGLALQLNGATQSRPSIKLPGGFEAKDGAVTLPIRFFGDRRFALLYELRDRLPQEQWLPALEAAKPPSARRSLVVVSLAAAVSVGAVLAVFFSIAN